MKQIERLFYEDVRDKKRTGRGIFSRVSTRKGGTNQALRTPYLSMSRKERNKINGKVVTYNMNEIMPYESFVELEEEQQKRLLENWRDQYSNKEIEEKMGTTFSQLQKLIRSLKVKKKEFISRAKKSPISEEELATYKREFVTYEIFKTMSNDEQEELLTYYRTKASLNNLSQIWGVRYDQVAYYTKKFSNKRKKREEAEHKASNSAETVTTLEEVATSQEEAAASVTESFESTEQVLQTKEGITTIPLSETSFSFKENTEATPQTGDTAESLIQQESFTDEPAAQETSIPAPVHNPVEQAETLAKEESYDFSFALSGKQSKKETIQNVKTLLMQLLETEGELLCNYSITIQGKKQ